MRFCRLDYPFLQTMFTKINVFPPFLPITTFAVESLFLNGGWVGNVRQAGAANPPVERAGYGNDFRIDVFYEGLAAASPIILSFFELGLGGKLSMQVSLDWWNFEESVAGFFAHCIAIAGLYIALSYYTMKWLQKPKPDRLSARDTEGGPRVAPKPAIAVAGSDNRGGSRGTKGTNPPEPE